LKNDTDSRKLIPPAQGLCKTNWQATIVLYLDILISQVNVVLSSTNFGLEVFYMQQLS
jgi:hypothetical protein